MAGTSFKFFCLTDWKLRIRNYSFSIHVHFWQMSSQLKVIFHRKFKKYNSNLLAGTKSSAIWRSKPIWDYLPSFSNILLRAKNGFEPLTSVQSCASGFIAKITFLQVDFFFQIVLEHPVIFSLHLKEYKINYRIKFTESTGKYTLRRRIQTTLKTKTPN